MEAAWQKEPLRLFPWKEMWLLPSQLFPLVVLKSLNAVNAAVGLAGVPTSIRCFLPCERSKTLPSGKAEWEFVAAPFM